MTHEEKWLFMFNLVSKFKSHYGDLKIPVNFRTLDGFTYNKNGYNIYSWLRKQKSSNLSKNQIDLLKGIGYDLKKKKSTYKSLSWNEWYQLALKYYEHNKHLEIDYNFKTLDGITYNKKGYNLHAWIERQRLLFKNGKLSKDKKELLDKLKMRWDNLKQLPSWNEMYELAKKYYEHYKNLEVDRNFKTLDGITYDENGYNLGAWIATQRYYYNLGKLLPERKKLLDKLEFRFDKLQKKKEKPKKEITHLELSWKEHYKLLENFYNHYKHTNVPYLFRTNDGINYDEKGFLLGRWLKKQKYKYRDGLLETKYIKLLQKLNVDLKIHSKDDVWYEKFELTKKYYEEYGNLNFSVSFKTKNGVDYDEFGVHLGEWLGFQRNQYRKGVLEPERYYLLSNIGMVWNILKEDKRIVDLCMQYNIDYDNNQITLEHISYYELNAKINYLVSNNMPIVNNGQLHEIFNMCNKNMICKYNIDLETMIIKYYKKDLLLERK